MIPIWELEVKKWERQRKKLLIIIMYSKSTVMHINDMDYFIWVSFRVKYECRYRNECMQYIHERWIFHFFHVVFKCSIFAPHSFRRTFNDILVVIRQQTQYTYTFLPVSNDISWGYTIQTQIQTALVPMKNKVSWCIVHRISNFQLVWMYSGPDEYGDNIILVQIDNSLYFYIKDGKEWHFSC